MTERPTQTAAAPDFILYCDEAGNTGDDYMNEDQPVFVVAGVLIPTRARDLLAARVAQLESEFRRATSLSGKKEAKSKKLLRTEVGRRLAVEFVKGLNTIHAMPVIAIAEKTYSAAAKVVETLFDPAHNPAAGWVSTWDNVERQRLAEVFARYPRPLLEQFVAAYQEPSRPAFEACIAALKAHSDALGHQRTAETLEGALHSLEAILESEQLDGGEPGGRGASIAINLPIFLSVLTSADKLVTEVGGRCSVIHDETTEFEPIFRFWFEAFRGVEPFVVTGLSDGREARYGFGGLDTLLIDSSRVAPGIRAADVVAGLLTSVAKAGMRGPLTSPEFIAARNFFAPLLVAYAPTSTITSEEFLRDALSKI